MERTGGMALGGARMPVRVPKGLLRLRPDARLVDHVRAGDDAAFEVLYERHVAGILAFCRHMLGSREEAEDATQHTFVAAHRDIQRSRRELALKPWLYTIARNRCLSVLRARQERPAEDVELSTAGLQTEVERRADVRELLADLARLPDDQRAALVLTELGDLSHDEVAAVLGCKAAAVKGIVFRARNALIERREARAADCAGIREQLAAATGGTLRRSRLRYHLEGCPGCTAYLEEVRRQRKLLGVALPVVPTLALHDSVMASVGIGAAGATGVAGAAGAVSGSAAGAAGATGGGSSLLGLGSSAAGGVLAKVAIVGALAGGAGVATKAAVTHDRGASPPPAAAPAGDRDASGGSPVADPTGSRRGETGRARSGERGKGRRGAEQRRRGWQRARERSRGRANAGRRGRRGVGVPPGRAIGRGGESPGRAFGRDGQPPAATPAPPPGKPVAPPPARPVAPPPLESAPVAPAPGVAAPRGSPPHASPPARRGPPPKR